MKAKLIPSRASYEVDPTGLHYSFLLILRRLHMSIRSLSRFLTGPDNPDTHTIHGRRSTKVNTVYVGIVKYVEYDYLKISNGNYNEPFQFNIHFNNGWGHFLLWSRGKMEKRSLLNRKKSEGWQNTEATMCWCTYCTSSCVHSMATVSSTWIKER
jgi:hypothetical protein